MLAELESRLSTAIGSVRKGQEAIMQQRAPAAIAAPVAEAAAKSKRAAFDAQTEALAREHAEVPS